MNNSIVNMLIEALNKNQFEDFLLGNNEYFIENKEGQSSDYAVALYSGIYEYYKINSNIKELFEKTLTNMLNNDENKILVAFDYIYLQILKEINNESPFILDMKIYETLKTSIINNEDKLKRYNMNSETFAYNYITNIDTYFEEELGHKILK